MIRFIRQWSRFWPSALLLAALACSQAAPALSEPTLIVPTEATAPVPVIQSTSEPTATESPFEKEVPTSQPIANQSDSQNATSKPSLELRTPTEPPPKLDTSIASVSLDDVLFDTFDGGSVQLSQADDQLIDRLRGRIKPIYEPIYDSVDGGDWLKDDDLILGYVSESGSAFAYPVRMLNLHEIVNDVIDGVPVLISYCPLCASGVVYSRELDGDVLLFGNTSALYESDLVMFDHNTGSYWFQVLGEAIVGPLSEKRLTMLPSSTITWGDWRELHPQTSVLSRNLGLLRSGPFGDPYGRDPFTGYDKRVDDEKFAFPVHKGKLDNRLSAGTRVIAIQVNEAHKAYPLTDRSNESIDDELSGAPVLILVNENGPSGAAYFRTVDGQTLTFTLDDDVLIDNETASQWDASGKAISGQFAGAQLTSVPSRTSFWFSLVGSLPDVQLYVP